MQEHVVTEQRDIVFQGDKMTFALDQILLCDILKTQDDIINDWISDEYEHIKQTRKDKQPACTFISEKPFQCFHAVPPVKMGSPDVVEAPRV